MSRSTISLGKRQQTFNVQKIVRPAGDSLGLQ
jgi:hypothetical protein